MAGNDISFVARLKDEVSGKLGKIRDDFDRLGNSKAGMAVLQGVGLSAGVRMFSSIEGAIRGVVDIAQDAVRNASNLRESMALSQQVFEDSADTIDAWAATASEAFGMTKREALDTAAQFGNAFKNVGYSIDETADKSQTLTRLAADLGSAFNRSSAEAANALRAGLLGESEPMRRFGVFLNEVAVESWLTAKGIQKVGGEFTTAQKVMARYGLIMEQTADTQGMFGRDSGSLADAQKSLNAQLEDVSATVGTELLPYMVSFTEVLKDDLVPAIKTVTGAIKTLDIDFSFLKDNIFDFIAKGPFAQFDRQAAQGAERAREFGDRLEAMQRQIGRGATAFDSLTEAAGTVVPVLEEVPPPVDLIAKSLRGVEKEATDALVALGLIKYDPAQIKGAFAEAQQAVIDARKELREFKKGKDIDNLTEAQQRDLDILNGKLAKTKADLWEARVAMMKIDGLTFNEVIKEINRAGIKVDWLGDQWLRVLRYMIRINNEGYQDPGIGGYGGTQGARAAGGPVRPFGTYTVGEEGPETLVMGARGGYVVPGAPGGGGGGGGGGGPVVIQLTLDGRVLSQVVDRNLSYLRRTAPGVAPAAR